MKKAFKIFLIFALFIIGTGCKNTNNEYLIAYNVLVDPDSDNYDIFTMQLDGSNKKNITNHPDVAWTYLSSTNTLFFLSDRDTTRRIFFLYEINSNGNQINKITNFRMQDNWLGTRNNGSELIVKPHPTVDSLFYLIDRNGHLIKKIDAGTPHFSNPAFSPDGQSIAFVGKNKKSKRESGYKEEIFIVNVDGTDLKQLSHYPQEDTTAEWYAYKAGPPRWHPSGEFLTYQSKQKGKYSLYAVKTDGSKQWKLTNNPQDEGWHDWSPDGKWLAIELFNEKQTQFNIGLINWQSKQLTILTDSTYQYQQAPVFVERVR